MRAGGHPAVAGRSGGDYIGAMAASEKFAGEWRTEFDKAVHTVGGLESVERGVAELRRGGIVVVSTGEASTKAEAVLMRAAETVDVWPLPFFADPAVGALSLVVTGRRPSILGLSQPGARAVQLSSAHPLTPISCAP